MPGALDARIRELDGGAAASPWNPQYELGLLQCLQAIAELPSAPALQKAADLSACTLREAASEAREIARAVAASKVAEIAQAARSGGGGAELAAALEPVLAKLAKATPPSDPAVALALAAVAEAIAALGVGLGEAMARQEAALAGMAAEVRRPRTRRVSVKRDANGDVAGMTMVEDV